MKNKQKAAKKEQNVKFKRIFPKSNRTKKQFKRSDPQDEDNPEIEHQLSSNLPSRNLVWNSLVMFPTSITQFLANRVGKGLLIDEVIPNSTWIVMVWILHQHHQQQQKKPWAPKRHWKKNKEEDNKK